MQSNRKVAFNNFSFLSFFFKPAIFGTEKPGKTKLGCWWWHHTAPSFVSQDVKSADFMPGLGGWILCCTQRWLREELHPKPCTEFHRNSASWLPMHQASNTPLLTLSSLAKWNVPEASDWSCLILIYICSVGRFTSLKPSIIQGVPATAVKTTFCLAPKWSPSETLPINRCITATTTQRTICQNFLKWFFWLAFPTFLRHQL